MNAKGFTDEGTLTPDNLIVGEFPRIARKVTVTGGAYVKGAVLGRITASKKYKESTSAASDGSQIPDAILAEDVDASAADAEAIVYFTGEFNGEALKLGAGHTLTSIVDVLRTKSIFIKGA